jgi:hypothetical protein
MPLDFIKSEKGKDLLVDQGYIYRHERIISNSGKVIWRCIDHAKKKCRGRCHTIGQHVTHRSGHNHAPDAAKVEARRALNIIKDRAISSQDAPTNIIAQASSSISQAAAGQLPSLSSIIRNILRFRVREGQAPPNPATLADLVIHPNSEYAQTKNGENFLQFDSGPSEDRILIFSTQRIEHKDDSSLGLRPARKCSHFFQFSPR